jgi:hypothetical protein
MANIQLQELWTSLFLHGSFIAIAQPRDALLLNHLRPRLQLPAGSASPDG